MFLFVVALAVLEELSAVVYALLAVFVGTILSPTVLTLVLRRRVAPVGVL